MITFFSNLRQMFPVKLFNYVLVLSIMLTTTINTYSNSVSEMNMSISDFNITTSEVGDIEGVFTINNNSENVFPELWYCTQLYATYELGKSNLINYYSSKLSLTKLESKNINFSHKTPSNLPNVPDCTYSVILRVFNRSGIVLTMGYKELDNIGNSSNFLSFELDKTKFTEQEVNASPQSGPTYKQDHTPVLKTVIKNLGTNDIKGYIKIVTFKRYFTYESKPIDNTILPGKITFEPNEEKTIDINLPIFNTPESYYLNISFVDESSVEISGIMEARYVMEGKSAKIVQNTTDYENGTLFVTQTIAGPADASDFENVTVGIEVYDNAKKILFKDEKMINIGINPVSVIFEKTMDLKARSIIIKHFVKYEDKTLDSLENIYKTKDVKFQPTVEKLNPTAVPTETPYEKIKPTLVPTETPDEEQKPTPIPSDILPLKDIINTEFEIPVYYLQKKGIVKGYEDYTFRPANKITRAEFVTNMIKLVYPDNNDNNEEKSQFQDVSTKHWASKNINIGFKYGILRGYPGGSFMPEENVTFAEAITVCSIVLASRKSSSTIFKVWPDDYISYATKQTIDIGVNYNPSNPKIPASRGEIAKLIYNLSNIMTE